MSLDTAGHPVRVLMISPQFRPILGGYERAAERLALALADRGTNVCILAERRDRAWPRVEYINRITLYRWWCIYRPHLHILSSVIGLVANLLRIGRHYDVWHVHQYGVHAMVAVICGKLIGRPVVMKLTSSSYQGLSMMVAKSRMPRIMAATLRRLDAVVALTRETVAEAIAFGIPIARVHLLGNGVDVETFTPPAQTARMAIKEALGLGSSPVVLFVGRLSAEKNPCGLLQAWVSVRGNLASDWKLVMVGDGPERAMIDALVSELELSDQVVIAGRQDGIERWMQAAEIYVLSSQREGLSNALLEAMASGLPVVATRVSGVTELIEETGAGLVVDVGDMHGLGRSLAKLAGDPDLCTDMGKRARRAIESRFAITSVAAAHEKLYRQLNTERYW